MIHELKTLKPYFDALTQVITTTYTATLEGVRNAERE